MSNLEQAARQALEWAESHGEIVFAGGGMAATDAMNAWAAAIRAALEQHPTDMEAIRTTFYLNGLAAGTNAECRKCPNSQAQPPATPTGYKLVPVEPNIGMTQAALYVSRSYAEHYAPLRRCHELNDAALVYRAMLAAAPPILEDSNELFKKSGKPKLLTGPCGQCGDTKHPCFCSTVDAPFEDSSPTVTSHRQPLTTEQYTQLAHRIASRYSHRSDPQFIAYTFLPHTLEQFVRAIEAAISNQ